MEVLPTPGAPTKTTLMWLSFSFPKPFPLCDWDFSGSGVVWLVVTCHSVCESLPWPPPHEFTASTIFKKENGFKRYIFRPTFNPKVSN